MRSPPWLVRTLKPGKTYDDFVAAWYPDRGFGVEGMGPVLATNAANEQLLAFGIFDIPDETVAATRPPGLSR